MRYIDTHCHIQKEYYENNEIEEIIAQAKENGLTKIIAVGTTIDDSIELHKLASKYEEYLLPTFGLHPSEADSFDVSRMAEFDASSYVAIGEVGIDLYHEDNPHIDHQIFVFEQFIKLAINNNKPLIVHMRNSEQQTYDVLKKYPNLKYVMHSFTSTLDWATKFIEIGAYISFSGIVTFKNAKDLHEVARQLPLEKIICETDAPFLTPMPFRGQKNKAHYVKYVVEKIAELKGESVENVANCILNNSMTLFNIK